MPLWRCRTPASWRPSLCAVCAFVPRNCAAWRQYRSHPEHSGFSCHTFLIMVHTHASNFPEYFLLDRSSCQALSELNTVAASCTQPRHRRCDSVLLRGHAGQRGRNARHDMARPQPVAGVALLCALPAPPAHCVAPHAGHRQLHAQGAASCLVHIFLPRVPPSRGA